MGRWVHQKQRHEARKDEVFEAGRYEGAEQLGGRAHCRSNKSRKGGTQRKNGAGTRQREVVHLAGRRSWR
eukprot:3879258-Pleurochrysis_carterae.AAC.1